MKIATGLLGPVVATEVTFFPVGTGSSGDAIIVRTADRFGYQECYLIDGGFAETADQIRLYLAIERINRLNGIINTHPDLDHIGGATELLETDVAAGNLKVDAVYMHEPWRHSAAADFYGTRFTPAGRAKHFVTSLKAARSLQQAAAELDIPVISPFAGDAIGPFRVLAPSWNRYLRLLPQFTEDVSAASTPVRRNVAALSQPLSQYLGNARTSARNESSLVLYLEHGPTRALFTGDVGPMGLFEAIHTAHRLSLPLTALDIFDVPHHGSRRNLSAGALMRIRGSVAVISAGSEDTEHPRALVVGALMQHRWTVTATRGRWIRFANGFALPADIEPLPTFRMPAVVEVAVQQHTTPRAAVAW